MRVQQVKVPNELRGIVESSADTLHGALRFVGTRVFVQSLWDYVMNGSSLSLFLEHFPDVKKEQAEAVLAWERERLKRETGFDLSA